MQLRWGRGERALALLRDALDAPACRRPASVSRR
jgi:hypothetical protein